MKHAIPWFFLKQYFDALIGRRSQAGGSTESGVRPVYKCRRIPLRRALLRCVRHAHTKTARPIGVVERAKRPVSGIVHLHDRFDALAPGERKHPNRGGGWHWVFIERDYTKEVSR